MTLEPLFLGHGQDYKMRYIWKVDSDVQESSGNLYITYSPVTQDIDESGYFTSALFNFLTF